ncbi:MAG: efflux RND transporter periplasmic adaptor subunit [Chitinophagaceae bacterium]
MKPLVILSLCLAITWNACKTETDKEKPKTYTLIAPRIVDTVYEDTYVAEIHSLQHVELRAKVKGMVESIQVDEGKMVQAGQTLFTLVNSEYSQALQKTKAATRSTLAEMKMAVMERENAKKLFEKKIIGKPEYDVAIAKVDILKAKLEEAEAEEKLAQLNLTYLSVQAPFSGTINRIPNKKGSLVEAGSLLTTLSNNREIFAYFNVSENDYLDYQMEKDSNEHRKIKLVLANGMTYNYPGVIDAVESEIDRETGTIRFRARFPNPEALLKHGASGKVVKTKILRQALMIPQKSTFEIQDKVFVFVVNKNNVVEQRNVQVAMRFPHQYAIASGLNPEDQILFEGVQSVKAGDKIPVATR